MLKHINSLLFFTFYIAPMMFLQGCWYPAPSSKPPTPRLSQYVTLERTGDKIKINSPEGYKYESGCIEHSEFIEVQTEKDSQWLKPIDWTGYSRSVSDKVYLDGEELKIMDEFECDQLKVYELNGLTINIIRSMSQYQDRVALGENNLIKAKQIANELTAESKVPHFVKKPVVGLKVIFQFYTPNHETVTFSQVLTVTP